MSNFYMPGILLGFGATVVSSKQILSLLMWSLQLSGENKTKTDNHRHKCMITNCIKSQEVV